MHICEHNPEGFNHIDSLVIREVESSFNVISTLHVATYKFFISLFDPPDNIGRYLLLSPRPKKAKRKDRYDFVAKYISPGDDTFLILKYNDPQNKCILPVLLLVIRDNYEPDLTAYDDLASILSEQLKCPVFLHEVEVSFDCIPAPGSSADQWLFERIFVKFPFRLIQITRNGTFHFGGRRSPLRVRLYRRNKENNCTRLEFVFRFNGRKENPHGLRRFIECSYIENLLLGRVCVARWSMLEDPHLPEKYRKAFSEGGLQAIYSGGVGENKLYAKVSERKKARRRYTKNDYTLSKKFDEEIISFSMRWLRKDKGGEKITRTPIRRKRTPKMRQAEKCVK